ncbi:MAG: 30S ribosomal protein S20 [Desulfobacteraceae bacterium]|uniref:Small ribosomal subunit protein bS20 n=1 Tax=Candidatus Desulfaltia bathyphila TaxID=2841697 RepID=A0A8J6N6L4_9BACT|nr:30S ribosomal protein S20 [Candidatus Desulfaltia bathyphila]MBL7194801.1 30S ribosomal protein S20 [Desulfobacterales bacterium]
MANHKSALKRARQNEERRMRNKTTMTKVKNIVKDVRLAAGKESNETVLNKLNQAQSIIDKAAKKGTIHKKNASRKISRLAGLVNSITV